jgi:hypothetical protein
MSCDRKTWQSSTCTCVNNAHVHVHGHTVYTQRSAASSVYHSTFYASGDGVTVSAMFMRWCCFQWGHTQMYTETCTHHSSIHSVCWANVYTHSVRSCEIWLIIRHPHIRVYVCIFIYVTHAGCWYIHVHAVMQVHVYKLHVLLVNTSHKPCTYRRWPYHLLQTSRTYTAHHAITGACTFICRIQLCNTCTCTEHPMTVAIHEIYLRVLSRSRATSSWYASQ